MWGVYVYTCVYVCVCISVWMDMCGCMCISVCFWCVSMWCTHVCMLCVCVLILFSQIYQFSCLRKFLRDLAQGILMAYSVVRAYIFVVGEGGWKTILANSPGGNKCSDISFVF